MGLDSEPELKNSDEWLKRYAVQVDHIDDQHAELASKIAVMELAAKSGDNEELARQLIKVLQLMEQHFNDEEEFMSEHQYPGLCCHARVHSEFLQEGNELLERVTTGTGIIGPGFFERLRYRLEDHVDIQDRKYIAYCKGAKDWHPAPPPPEPEAESAESLEESAQESPLMAEQTQG